MAGQPDLPRSDMAPPGHHVRAGVAPEKGYGLIWGMMKAVGQGAGTKLSEAPPERGSPVVTSDHSATCAQAAVMQGLRGAPSTENRHPGRIQINHISPSQAGTVAGFRQVRQVRQVVGRCIEKEEILRGYKVLGGLGGLGGSSGSGNEMTHPQSSWVPSLFHETSSILPAHLAQPCPGIPWPWMGPPSPQWSTLPRMMPRVPIARDMVSLPLLWGKWRSCGVGHPLTGTIRTSSGMAGILRYPGDSSCHPTPQEGPRGQTLSPTADGIATGGPPSSPCGSPLSGTTDVTNPPRVGVPTGDTGCHRSSAARHHSEFQFMGGPRQSYLHPIGPPRSAPAILSHRQKGPLWGTTLSPRGPFCVPTQLPSRHAEGGPQDNLCPGVLPGWHLHCRPQGESGTPGDNVVTGLLWSAPTLHPAITEAPRRDPSGTTVVTAHPTILETPGNGMAFNVISGNPPCGILQYPWNISAITCQITLRSSGSTSRIPA